MSRIRKGGKTVVPTTLILLTGMILGGAGASFITRSAAADQPAMQKALDNLQAAERDLMAATNDKGGHRKQALEYTRKAIKETREGIGYDRRH